MYTVECKYLRVLETGGAYHNLIIDEFYYRLLLETELDNWCPNEHGEPAAEFPWPIYLMRSTLSRWRGI